MLQLPNIIIYLLLKLNINFKLLCLGRAKTEELHQVMSMMDIPLHSTPRFRYKVRHPFQSKVHQYSGAKVTNYSAAKYTTLLKE